MSAFSLNTRRFEEALRFVETTTGRSMADSLNRAALHVVIGSGAGPGAMQLTPKASKGAISAVTARQLAGYVITKAKQTGKWPLTREEIKERVKRERKRRQAAAGYTAFAGWNKAAQKLGGKGLRRGIQPGFARSEAARGDATKATAINLVAEIVNTAPMAERIGGAALQDAINNAAQDLVDYGTRKLAQNMKKVQP